MYFDPQANPPTDFHNDPLIKKALALFKNALDTVEPNWRADLSPSDKFSLGWSFEIDAPLPSSPRLTE